MIVEPISPDDALEQVVAALISIDPSGARFARVFRETFDQLYDGQRTGRYKWDQLYKTEKTHYGTLIEINLQREFAFADGNDLPLLRLFLRAIGDDDAAAALFRFFDTTDQNAVTKWSDLPA